MTPAEEKRNKRRAYLLNNPEQMEKARARARVAAAAKRAEDPGHIHRAAFYAELVALQGSETCYICGEGPSGKRLQIDHDHETDEIRGLLCGRCNRMLGQALDSEEILLRALDYLRRRPRTGKFYADFLAVPIQIRYTKKDAA